MRKIIMLFLIVALVLGFYMASKEEKSIPSRYLASFKERITSEEMKKASDEQLARTREFEEKQALILKLQGEYEELQAMELSFKTGLESLKIYASPFSAISENNEGIAQFLELQMRNNPYSIKDLSYSLGEYEQSMGPFITGFGGDILREKYLSFPSASAQTLPTEAPLKARMIEI